MPKNKAKPVKKAGYVLPPGMALGLRTCKADMTSPSSDARGFKWPNAGKVMAPDWEATKECGNGLHLLPHGEGSGLLIAEDMSARWLVCEYDPTNAVDVGGKVKVAACVVVFVGTRSAATKWIGKHDPLAKAVGYSTNTGGDGSTNAGGNYSTNTGGDGSTNAGGNYSTNTGGDYSTNAGGYGSTNAGGDYSKNAGGYGSKNAGGYGSKNAGGYGSTAKSGDVGVIAIDWCYGNRRRIAVGYVGEDGIKPDTWYKVDETGKLVEVKP